MVYHLFVYGSLRKSPEGKLHPYLNKTAIFVSCATVPGKLFQIANYPGAVPVPSSIRGVIYGEVYRLTRPQQALRLLDQYEECTSNFPEPHEFRRTVEIVTCANGKRHRAWIYWYCRPTVKLAPICHGDYLAYLRETTTGA